MKSWDLFVLRHQDPLNIKIHFFSFVIYYSSLIMLLITLDPLWILGLFVSGLIGAAGHRITKDGQFSLSEATYDPRVVLYVTWMVVQVILKKYQFEIERVNTLFRSQGQKES